MQLSSDAPSWNNCLNVVILLQLAGGCEASDTVEILPQSNLVACLIVPVYSGSLPHLWVLLEGCHIGSQAAR